MRRTAAKLGRGLLSPSSGLAVQIPTHAPSPLCGGGGAAEPEVPSLRRALRPYAPAPRSSTITARRFCDQHEMSLHTATGRSLPYDTVRMRLPVMPRVAR